MINRIAFYDMDGTLMDTPMPDTGKIRWKEVTGQDYPHVGWWTKKESLDTKVFDIKPFPTVISQLNKDTARPDTLTVLLTNRSKQLTPQVMKILKMNNIKFDAYSLHDGKGEKDDRIERFIKKYPTVKEIDFFDDREKEILLISRLKRMVRDDNININVYRVNKGNISLVESTNNLKNIIQESINEYDVDIAEPPTPTTPTKFGDDGDDDWNKYPYFLEWYDYFDDGDDKRTPVFAELWNDELSIKKHLENRNETDSHMFYENLWDKFRSAPDIHKEKIENLIKNYIDKYNNWASDYRENQRSEKEIQDIMNNYEIEFDGVNVQYMLEKPTSQQVKRFMVKDSETEEEANRPLLSVKKIDLPQKPPENQNEMSGWLKNYYMPFFSKNIEPWIEKNNYRLWGY